MTSLEKIKSVETLSEFAKLLGYKPSALSYILYVIPDQNKYTQFTIDKKSGGVRTINAPNDQLKNLQKRLSDLLIECYEEILKKNIKSKTLSHGFRKDHSIITNAKKHKNKRYVFNLDLQDFFPSINFGRVRGFFNKNLHFELNLKISTIISQISCYRNELPQGSPCSPIISNLIGHLLDVRMAKLAKKSKCTYSRYADDLTFSTNNKIFPSIIAIKSEFKDTAWVCSDKLKKEIEKLGFKINENKVHLQYNNNRQIVTGLVVNEKVNVKYEYYNKARAMCLSLFNYDLFYNYKKIGSEKIVFKNFIDDKNKFNKLECLNYINNSNDYSIGKIKELDGILSYIHNVKKDHDIRATSYKASKPSAFIKLNREFLFYKHFFSSSVPVIICEGKTDIVYLKCALKRLYDFYPDLIQKNSDCFKFNISFLNFSKNLKNVFCISEGTPGLTSLLGMYSKFMKPFKGSGMKNPVIMLVDNDSGSSAIKSLVKYDPQKKFYNYGNNLYVVVIPNNGTSPEVSIENLFTDDILSTVINGKSFNKNDKIDISKEYGKSVFAEKVVLDKMDSIDFSNFKLIFDRFDLIVKHHSEIIS